MKILLLGRDCENSREIERALTAAGHEVDRAGPHGTAPPGAEYDLALEALDPPGLLARIERVGFAEAFLAMSAAALVLDPEGRVRRANRAAQSLLGRREPDLAGQEVRTFLRAVESAGPPEGLDRALATGGRWAAEVHVLHPDGAELPALAALAAIDGASAPGAYVLTLRDLSDRVAMEEELRRQYVRLAEQAALDPLTKIYHRGYFHDALQREIARSQRYETPLSLLVVDVDGFKRVNEDYLHPTGDRVLVEIVQCMRENVREGDVVARLGGDEFGLLMPNTEMPAACAAAERLLVAARERRFGGDARLRLTLSGGVATTPDLPGRPLEAAELLEIADRLLFESKHRGGDRVTRPSDVDPDA